MVDATIVVEIKSDVVILLCFEVEVVIETKFNCVFQLVENVVAF